MIAVAGDVAADVARRRRLGPGMTSDTPEARAAVAGQLAAWHLLARRLLGGGGAEAAAVLRAEIAQEETFMADLLPAIQALLHRRERGPTIAALDVGPRWCAGSELVARLHHPSSYSTIALEVTAIDLFDHYLPMARLIAPNVRHLVADVATLPRASYGIVVCSHVIEHLQDPTGYVERLRSLTSDWLVLGCPHAEQDRLDYHLSSIDLEFARATGAIAARVYSSVTWAARGDCLNLIYGRSPPDAATWQRLTAAGYVPP